MNRRLAFLSPLIVLAVATSSLAQSLTVSSKTGTNLNLEGEGSTAIHIEKVATLTASPNGSNDYTLTITSGDIAKFGGQPIAFQVTTVAAGASAPGTPDFLTASGDIYEYCAATIETRDLYIKYEPLALQDPGFYSGSITLTLSDGNACQP